MISSKILSYFLFGQIGFPRSFIKSISSNLCMRRDAFEGNAVLGLTMAILFG